MSTDTLPPFNAGLLAEACRLRDRDPLQLEEKHLDQLRAFPGEGEKAERAIAQALERGRREMAETLARQQRKAPDKAEQLATAVETTIRKGFAPMAERVAALEHRFTLDSSDPVSMAKFGFALAVEGSCSMAQVVEAVAALRLLEARAAMPAIPRDTSDTSDDDADSSSAFIH